MSTRSLAIMGGVFAVLVLAIVLLGRKEQAAITTSAELLVPAFDEAKATKIWIKTKAREDILEQKDGVWTVVGEGFKADTEAVKNLLDRLQEAKIADVASTNPERAKVFEVDKGGERAVEVQVSAGDAALAHFFVGKDGPDFASSYVRLEGSDKVVRVGSRLREAFDRGTRGWRDRAIFNLVPDQVVGLSLSSPELTAELSASGEGAARTWTVSADGVTSPAETDAARAVTETLATLHTDEFAAATVTESEAGLDQPSRKAMIKLKDGASRELAFGKDTDAGRIHARADGSPTIYLVGKYRIGQIFKKLDELKAKPAPTPEPPPTISPEASPAAATPSPSPTAP